MAEIVIHNTVNIISWVLMIAGVLLCAIGVLGVFRMPDLFSKQHSSGLIDTLGMLFITCSLACRSGASFLSLKVILLGALSAFLSAPICNALIKSAVINKILHKSTNKDQDATL